MKNRASGISSDLIQKKLLSIVLIIIYHTLHQHIMRVVLTRRHVLPGMGAEMA